MNQKWSINFFPGIQRLTIQKSYFFSFHESLEQLWAEKLNCPEKIGPLEKKFMQIRLDSHVTGIHCVVIFKYIHILIKEYLIVHFQFPLFHFSQKKKNNNCYILDHNSWPCDGSCMPSDVIFLFSTFPGCIKKKK